MSSVTGNFGSNNVVAIIPARGGSKRVASKNIRDFAGKPLLAYSIAAAKAAGIFSRIIVSTDSEEIAAIARAHGAETPFIRPAELADDFCPMADVVRHAVKFVEQQGRVVDFSCCIFATAPMVSAEDIRRGYEALRTDSSFRSALAVTGFEFPIQRALKLNEHHGLEMLHPEYRLTRSQDLEPCYHDAAQFVWTNNHYDEKQPNKGIKPVFIDRRRVQDIDTPEDWRLAEYQYRVFAAIEKEAALNELFNSTFKIGKDEIGPGHPVYLVAEMSANHGQDYGKAVEIIHAAKEAGANAIKLQTYSADTLTIDCKSAVFYIDKGPWKGQYMYDLYQGAMMPWEWHADLKAEADKIGLTIFSAPFDATAVQLLAELDFPAMKIASPELIDLDLIRCAAETGKPLIISTGLGTLAEIQEAVNVVRESGNKNLCLLKCTSEYPAPYENMHLRTIPHLQQTFGCSAGLSDHSMGISVPVAAVALGACMIEKHFILSREDKTVDSFFSLTADEFALMAKSVREAEKALGEVSYPTQSDPARRSLYAVADIAEGEAFTKENVRNLRPGVGIPPKHLNEIVGRTSRRSVKRGEPLYWNMIS